MVDMHIHTNNSDGTQSTKEIIEMLKQQRIKLFSITDHDNFESCKEMEKIQLPKNMIYIPGIEFSSKHNEYDCHILGYNINYKNETLLEECRLIRRRRQKKIIQVLKYIRENYGIISESEEKNILNKNGTIGRFDICELLMKKGYGKRQEIYKKYLSPKDLITHRSKSKTIIDVIHASGGKAILAHPREIEDDYQINIEDIIESLIVEGLDGIEIYNSIHTPEDVKRYRALAKKYDEIISDKSFLTTGGSDFHGTNKPEIILGTTTSKHIKIKEKDIFFPY